MGRGTRRTYCCVVRWYDDEARLWGEDVVDGVVQLAPHPRPISVSSLMYQVGDLLEAKGGFRRSPEPQPSGDGADSGDDTQSDQPDTGDECEDEDPVGPAPWVRFLDYIPFPPLRFGLTRRKYHGHEAYSRRWPLGIHILSVNGDGPGDAFPVAVFVRRPAPTYGRAHKGVFSRPPWVPGMPPDPERAPRVI
jgi:hypothetical protein